MANPMAVSYQVNTFYKYVERSSYVEHFVIEAILRGRGQV